MHLWILRHGEAHRPPHLDDADRPLSEVGTRQANAVAQALKELDILQEIWSSPLLRAKQTSEPVAKCFPQAIVREVEELAPGSQPKTIVDLLRATHARSILLVGHEPLTGELTSYLAAGDSSLHIEFSPCTLALLSFGREIRKGGGVLKALMPPETIERKHIPYRS